MDILTFPSDLIEKDTNRYGNNRLCINIFKNNMSVSENVSTTIVDTAGNIVNTKIPTSIANDRSKRIYSNKEYTIFLPTPLSISTNYAVNYTDVSVTDLGASLVSSATSGITNIVGGLLARKNPLYSAAVAGLPNFFDKLPIKEAATIAGLETGLAINPHQETLLNGVKFREFKISYNLIAKRDGESKTIKNIIRALKVSMHPELAASSLLFKYPSEFELIFYTTSAKENPYLFKTKRCILKNLDVSYGKNFVTFKDTNAPVEIELSMTFQETEILTRETIEKEETEGPTY
jgi:hypothetical protein